MQDSSVRSPSPSSNIGKFGMSRPKPGISHPSPLGDSSTDGSKLSQFGASKLPGSSIQKTPSGITRSSTHGTPRSTSLKSSGIGDITKSDTVDASSAIESSSASSTGSNSMSEKSIGSTSLSIASIDLPVDRKDSPIDLSKSLSKPVTTKFETVKPDFFPSQPIEPPPPVHKIVAASEEVLDLQRRLMEKEKAAIDFEEKLNVLKQKRQQDQAKIKEIDKIKIQNQQVNK